mgnify:CR=1 FL=1
MDLKFKHFDDFEDDEWQQISSFFQSSVADYVGKYSLAGPGGWDWPFSNADTLSFNGDAEYGRSFESVTLKKTLKSYYDYSAGPVIRAVKTGGQPYGIYADMLFNWIGKEFPDKLKKLD